MKRLIPLVLALCMPVAWADNLEELTYQSAEMTGATDAGPFQGILTGTVLFDTTALAAQQYVVPISYSFTLDGISFLSTAPTLITLGCGSTTNCIGLKPSTDGDGIYTGAGVNLLANSYHSPFTQLIIGPTGDYVTYTYGSTQGGGCQGTCALTASSQVAGTWVDPPVANAPELDSSTAAGALTLLMGALVLVRGRRK